MFLLTIITFYIIYYYNNLFFFFTPGSAEKNMLKKLTIRNFVHFQEEQAFVFDGGPYFFIGKNRSGKSCTFEAVRRCMSTTKNLFISTSHDKAEPSCVICEFASSRADDGQTIRIFSSVIGVPCADEDDSNETKVKVVAELSEKNKFFVDLVKKNKHGYPVNRMFPMNDATHLSIQTLIEDGISTESLTGFVRHAIVGTKAYKLFMSEAEEINHVTETDCETYLKQTIDKEVVITEPMRSVSVAQWSNSPKFDRLERSAESNDIFVHETQFKSDIIGWYLDSQNISDEERNAVDDIFNILTENSRLRFEKRDNVLHVIDNGNVVTLEKAPEGLLESMICAILLSMKQFKTLCLEEPGKGMHVQMIERLRDVVLKQGQNKTIIMTTHVPAFLNSCKTEKIFFFRPSSEQNGKPLFRAIHGNELLPQKISADYCPSTIFFASRVILGEGRSDEQFILAIKSILLDDKDLAAKILKSAKSNLSVDTLYRFLSSLHVMALNGERNKLRFQKICKALALERYFILDYDAIVDGNGDTDKFFTEFDIKNLEKEFSDKGVSVLETKGLFVWDKLPACTENPNHKRGTIEDAMIKLVEIHGEKLKSLFIDNNVPLNWDYENDIKRKLFKDRNLTDENIEAVVRGVIQACLEHLDSDVFRLLKFLIQSAARECVIN